VSIAPVPLQIPSRWICIAWPKLDSIPESVSTNGVAPRRPGPDRPWSIQSNRFQISNLNPCLVADLVKSIENKLLNQKLQMIPRWNPWNV
jgi:hypothetical protein